MRSHFPLFSNPIDLAHRFWSTLLEEGDVAVDATCGNGKDSLALAQLLHTKKGKLVCIDIQAKAIENTKKLLEEEVLDFLPSVQFFNQSHETFPEALKGLKTKLIVFNLGYLPKGDKSLTTQTDSTLASISSAMSKIDPGGVICITCYPGHLEGKKEQDALLKTLSSLDPADWCFTTFFWANRNLSPSLFLVQKNSSI